MLIYFSPVKFVNFQAHQIKIILIKIHCTRIQKIRESNNGNSYGKVSFIITEGPLLLLALVAAVGCVAAIFQSATLFFQPLTLILTES